MFVQQMTSPALRREIPRKGGISESELRREEGASLVAVQQHKCVLVFRLREAVPCSAGRSLSHRYTRSSLKRFVTYNLGAILLGKHQCN